jgi:predicted DNA binding CopG/RHH family protein
MGEVGRVLERILKIPKIKLDTVTPWCKNTNKEDEMEEKTIRTNISLPESLWEKTKIRAAIERVPFTEIARRALKEYLEKKSKKKGGK